MNAEPIQPTILYCNCSYAKVVPVDVKREVLQRLSASGRCFEAVADLCEMSAKRDPALEQLMQQPRLRIAACYPRAVKWLCSAAGTSLPETAEVINMRTLSADEVVMQLVSDAPPGESSFTSSPSSEASGAFEGNEAQA